MDSFNCLTPLVDGPQPARLHRHRDAVGDQLHEVLAAVAVARRAEQPDRAAQRRCDGQRDVQHDRPARGSGTGELGGAPAVALVDDHGHGAHVEHVAQAPHELLDQLKGLEAVREARGHVQQPPGLLGADPARRPVRRRGRGGLVLGGGAREREPDRVPTVGVVAGAPGGGEARDEAQPAAVGRGPAVPAPGLGEVRFEGTGTAVGDGDGERGLVDLDAQLELGARVQHGVLGELAGQEHRGVGDFGVEVTDGVEHLLQHPAGLPADRASGGSRIRRCSKAGTGCSVPGAARSRLRCLPRRGGAGQAPGGPPRGSGPLRWRTGAGRRAVGGRPWRPRGEAETVTTARKARLDPADHHAAADPAEAVLAELTDALAQLRRGRFDVRLPRREGAAGALADQFNDMAAVAQRHNRDLLADRAQRRPGGPDGRPARRGVLRRRVGRRARVPSTR